MRLEMSGFIQKDQFDLNSYLTYLFNRLHEYPEKEEQEKKLFSGGKIDFDS